MPVIYSPHLETKIKERGIDKHIVEDTITDPDSVARGLHGRTIFERKIDEDHKIKVVCEKEDEIIKVITCYITKVGR